MKTLKIEIQEKQHGSETEYRIVSEKGDIIYQTFNYDCFVTAKTAIESYMAACAKNAGRKPCIFGDNNNDYTR